MNNLDHITNLTDLLTLAIEDMKIIKSNPRYNFNVSYWHRPPMSDNDRCTVCVAGSIMANTLKAPIEECFSPLIFDRKTELKLSMINLIRTGHFIRKEYESAFGRELTSDIDSVYDYLYEGVDRTALETGDTEEWEKLRDNARELGL